MSKTNIWTPKDLKKTLRGRWIHPPPPNGWRLVGVTQWVKEGSAGHLVFTRNPWSWNRTTPDDALALPHAPRLGITAAVVQREQLPRLGPIPKSLPLLMVKSTRAALRDLAVAARDRFGGRVIAVTGSVGKTTTREMLRHILAPHGVAGNRHNNNNLVGVQKGMASAPSNAGACVLEMGFGKPIDGLAKNSKQVRPHVGLITTVSDAHLNMFEPAEIEARGGPALVAERKAQIFAGMTKGGVAVLGRDHAQFDRVAQLAEAQGLEIRSYGAGAGPGARIVELELGAEGSQAEVEIDGQRHTLSVRLPGAHMVVNALGAAVAAGAAGFDVAEACERLAGFEGVGGRARVVRVPVGDGHATVIDDHFNATPASMDSGLRVLQRLARERLGPQGRKIAVLGDMFYLGSESARLHAGIAATVREVGVELLLLDGPWMRHLRDAVADALPCHHGDDVVALYRELRAQLRAGDVVLVKSGRGRGGLGDLGFRAIVEHLERGDAELDPDRVSLTPRS